MTPAVPLIRDVVLVGGGHTHALVLRKWGMTPVAGARLTLINPDPTAPYTGMLPGYVAGHYARDELDYDLVKLCRFAGARLVLGRVTGLDTGARTLQIDNRPPMRYDIASLNLGITSALPDLPGFEDHAVAAKPLGPFATVWRAFLDGDGHRVAVLGAGVAGVELALAMRHALARRDRSPQITVIDRAGILSDLAAAPRRALLAEAEAQGVTLLPDTTVTRLTATSVEREGGAPVPADLIVSAAGARPFDWLADTGLDLTDGYITVGPDLRSSDPNVFASGDCAHLSHAPRPKAGVFAVRAAPTLDANIRAALTGGAAKHFDPQKSYLKLISLGRKSAIVDKWGLSLSGERAWDWKDRIDRKFMAKLSDLPAMPAPDLPAPAVTGLADALGEKPVCGGCGAKIGGDVLDQALARSGTLARDDVELAPGDDAAVLKIGGRRQVITTDHLRSFWDDAHVMARIAAVHALGDIWSMGAEPQAALSQITLPRLSPDLQAATLDDIMSAARAIFDAAGAAIVGGHTTQGAELQIGFTVTGLVDTPVTQSGARPGDLVVLTRPIGTGVIMAAEMSGDANGRHVAAALEQMATPQAETAAALSRIATAMTDVTGFGLAGHAWRIARASDVAITLDTDAVPLLGGALDLAERGIHSTLWADNVAAVPGAAPTRPREDLLFDPQTSGGFLATLPEGHPLPDGCTIIGRCHAGPPALTF